MDDITSTTPNKPITQKDAQNALTQGVLELAVSPPKTGIDWVKGVTRIGGPVCLLYAAATPEGTLKSTLTGVGLVAALLTAYLSNPTKTKGANGGTASGG